MLTHKQRALLLFIHERMTEMGVPPSFDEMKDALGLKSKSGIHRLITGLEERGFLKRMPHRARALEVLRLPDDQAQPAYRQNLLAGGMQAGLRDPSERYQAPRGVPAVQNDNQLPLVGRIAAGLPIEAIEQTENHIDVPSHLFGRGDHYVLEVDGDSMIEAGINDGDLVVIERGEVAHNGEIVVALVDGHEVTLKRWRKHENFVALEPANSRFETRVLEPGRVTVQGRLRGLMRSYH